MARPCALGTGRVAKRQAAAPCRVQVAQKTFDPQIATLGPSRYNWSRTMELLVFRFDATRPPFRAGRATHHPGVDRNMANQLDARRAAPRCVAVKLFIDTLSGSSSLRGVGWAESLHGPPGGSRGGPRKDSTQPTSSTSTCGTGVVVPGRDACGISFGCVNFPVRGLPKTVTTVEQSTG